MQQLGYNPRPDTVPASPELQQAVLGQLQRMLASAEFHNSDRMSRFLHHVVTFSLAGDEAALKESMLGIAVYGREAGYNLKIDPVVRSEARRLRDKIQRYYEREGEADAVRISLPKGGYIAHFQLQAPPLLQPEPVAPVLPAPGQSATESHPRVGVHRIVLVLAGLIAGIAISLVTARILPARSYDPGPISKSWTYPLTSLPGQELDPSISPDGRQVAFIWDRNGGDFDLYVIPAEGGEPRQLTATPERDLHPAFSPDGREIAFLRTSPAAIEVWKIRTDGTAATKITEIRWFEWFNWRSDLLLSTGYPGPAWTPDGSSLILSDVAGSQQGAALWEFDTKTGSRKQLSRPLSLSHDFFPAVSQDGRTIAFARQFSASNCDIFLIDRLTGKERRLTSDAQDVRGLTWMPDSQTLIYSSARGGAYQLWRLSVNGGSPVAVAASGDRVLGPTMSKNGRLLVYANATININLWTQTLQHGASAKPIVLSTGQNLYPRFSPDGLKVAFASDRTGGWEIWSANRDGSQQRQLTHLTRRSAGRMLGTPRWSPDGASIAFDARLNGNCAIYLMPATGGEPRLLERNSFEERNPVFSRDGRSLYFNSNRAGSVQIWRRPLDGGPALRVSTRRGYDAAESPMDGSVLFLPALAEPGVWKVERDGSGEQILLPTIPFLVRRHWDIAGKNLYFLGHDTEPRTLVRYQPGSAQVQRVTQLERNLIADVNSLAISPDERSVLFAQPDTLKSDLIAVLTEETPQPR
ncbi:MAG: PD40 domain-containing protein [Bryobacteraceae bacterium]|nr:PD40 domain-containing protein [Bryobacteraceae bacterium]